MIRENRRALKLYKKASLLWQLTPPFLYYSQCRFVPTCSEYWSEAVEKYGTAKGLAKTATRILRCNPFFKGGIDEA